MLISSVNIRLISSHLLPIWRTCGFWSHIRTHSKHKVVTKIPLQQMFIYLNFIDTYLHYHQISVTEVQNPFLKVCLNPIVLHLLWQPLNYLPVPGCNTTAFNDWCNSWYSDSQTLATFSVCKCSQLPLKLFTQQYNCI